MVESKFRDTCFQTDCFYFEQILAFFVRMHILAPLLSNFGSESDRAIFERPLMALESLSIAEVKKAECKAYPKVYPISVLFRFFDKRMAHSEAWDCI